MPEEHAPNLSDQLIKQLGLRPSGKTVNAPTASSDKVFAFLDVANVYLMESDLYGNKMPEGSLFLAFDTHSGLAGKHIRIETLHNSSVEDIRKMVADNDSG